MSLPLLLGGQRGVGGSAGAANRATTLAAEPTRQGVLLASTPLSGANQAWTNDPLMADRMGYYRSGGPRAVLQNRLFSDIFTFSRASVALDAGPDNVLQSYAAGQLRQGYLMGSLPAGWLLEGAATNIAYPSQNLVPASAFWSVARGTLTAAAAVGIDGTMSMNRFVEDTQTGAHGPFAALAPFAPSTTYTLSAWLKAGARTLFRLYFDGGPFQANQPVAEFNLTTGTVTGLANGATAKITAGPNGLYRCSVTGTGDATVGTGRALILSNNAANANVYTGDNVSDFYVGDVQLEANYFASSVIKTTTAAVTRAADSLAIDGARFNALWPATDLRQNQILQSDAFDNAGVWGRTGLAVTANTGATLDPFGGSTADLLTDDATNGAHYLVQTFTVVPGTAYSFSCYFKAGTRTKVLLQWFNSAFNSQFAAADLTAGTLISTTAGTVGNVIAVGNGWYRVTLHNVAIGTAGGIAIRMADAGGSTTYQGDSTGTLYVFGAMLETTPATLAPNLLTAGIQEDFGSATWAKSGTTVTANVATPLSPDFTATADKLQTDGAAGQHFLQANVITVAAGVPYVLSVYARAAELSSVALGFTGGGLADSGIFFDLSTGATSGPFGVAITTTATNAGSGWWRLTAAITPTSAVAFAARILLTAGTGTAGNGVHLFGAMLQQAATAPAYVPLSALVTTPYIPTTTAAASRYVGTAAAGFVIVDILLPVLPTANAFLVALNAGGISEETRLFVGSLAGLVAANTTTTAFTPNGVVVAGVPFRVGIAWGDGRLRICKDGGTLYQAASGPAPSPNQMQIGARGNSTFFANGRIRAVYAGASIATMTDAKLALCTVLGANIDAILAS